MLIRSQSDYASFKDYLHAGPIHQSVGNTITQKPTSISEDLKYQENTVEYASIPTAVTQHESYVDDLEQPAPQGPSIVDSPKLLKSTNRPSFASTVPITAPEDRPLIQYAYHETEFARDNLRYFLEHGLHDAADFVFILNGDTNADELIFPKGNPIPATRKRDSDLATLENGLAPEMWSEAEKARNEAFRMMPAKLAVEHQDINLLIHPRKNVKIVRRNNTCFDLGAHAEVLNSFGMGFNWFDIDGPVTHDPTLTIPLRSRYSYFILMNASIRGPFVPPFSNTCWSSAYLSRLSRLVKLVGMSFNCNYKRGHVQSMIWATDAVGMDILLKPQAIGVCFSEMGQAMEAEVHTTQFIREQGFEVDVFMQAYHSRDLLAKTTKYEQLSALRTNMLKQNPNLSRNDLAVAIQVENARLEDAVDVAPGKWWEEGCQSDTSDFLYHGGYYGTNLHPFENLFMKSHRHIDDNMLQRYTEWADGAGYSSYDVCK